MARQFVLMGYIIQPTQFQMNKVQQTYCATFIDSNIPLDGGSDHGYSNALYLSDIEGNGIEVYYDKDESTWDIKEDGKIIGVTEPIDATHLLNISKSVVPYTLPVGTIIGHVHLGVQNSTILLTSIRKYQDSVINSPCQCQLDCLRQLPPPSSC